VAIIDANAFAGLCLCPSVSVSVSVTHTHSLCCLSLPVCSSPGPAAHAEGALHAGDDAEGALALEAAQEIRAQHIAQRRQRLFGGVGRRRTQIVRFVSGARGHDFQI
jgi:hypothetical protein